MTIQYKGKKFKVKKVKGHGLQLDLSRKKIEDMSLISGLNELYDLAILYLDDNNITEIAGLSNLKNLHNLSLSYNKITEIKGIENLVNLVNLDLRSNQISEIKSLNNLQNLKQLTLSNNNISELKGLENLTNLNTLLLHKNPVFDWIKEEIGSFDLAKTAVKYCARKTGKELFNLNEVNNFLSLKTQEFAAALQEKNYFRVKVILKEVHDEVKLDDKTLFYKFFGEFLWSFPHLFDQKGFKEEYYPELPFMFTEKQGFQMETYVINNYCSYENEEVLTSFLGKIYSHKMWYEGRIHITNFRIFFFGKAEEEFEGGKVRSTTMRAALRHQAKKKYIMKQGQKLMSKFGQSEDLPSFGYEFPLTKAQNMAFATYVGISCILENRRFDMNIYPKQLENENETEFFERIKYIASFIPDS